MFQGKPPNYHPKDSFAGNIPALMLKYKEMTSGKMAAKGTVQHIWLFRVLAVILIGSTVLLWLSLTKHPGNYFAFTYRPYALAPLFGIVCYLVSFIVFSRIKAKGRTGMWFILTTICYFLWSVGDLLGVLAATPETYTFWGMWSTIGSTLLPGIFLIFILSYTQNDRLLYRWQTLSVILLFVCFLLLHYGNPNNFVTTTHVSTVPWGFTTGVGPYYGVYAFGHVSITLAGIYLLVRYHNRVLSKSLKKQVRLFIIGASVPIVGGIGAAYILPLVGGPSMPLTDVFIGIHTLINIYGISRYGLFAYDPAALASAVVTTVAEGLVILDDKGNVTQMNTTAGTLLDIDHRVAIGKKWHEIAKVYKGSNQAHDTNDPYQKRLDTGDVVFVSMEDDIYLRGDTARKIPVALTVTPLDNDAGNGTIIAFHDVTNDKQATQIIERTVQERTHELNKAKTQLSASINSLNQGFVMTDHLGQVITMNHAASLLFCPNNHGPNRHDETCTMADIIRTLHGHVDIQKKIDHVITKGKSAKLKNIPFGNKFFHLYLSPIHMENHVLGATMLMEDITEQRILDRSKDEFFSIASHELRTPLTAIRGNTKMMVEYYSDEIKDDTLKAMIRDVHESSLRLIEIVNDFLDLSRIEQGKIKYELAPFALDKAVEAVVYEMNTVAKQRGLTLTLDKITLNHISPVYGDHERFKQVLYNLIGNALKFTDSGSISVSFEPRARDIKILVSDTGRGISDENKQLLFRKFQQAGTSLYTRDTTKGTGLGLYICKLLTEAMGGNITLERSEPGKGSVFSVTVPIATKTQLANQPLADASQKTEADTARKEALLAEFDSTTGA